MTLATCSTVDCASGLVGQPDGPLHAEDGTVIGFFYADGRCIDCIDAVTAWELYRDIHGIKPRWMLDADLLDWLRNGGMARDAAQAREWAEAIGE